MSRNLENAIFKANCVLFLVCSVLMACITVAVYLNVGD